ncbi:isopenicillin N synthase family dioxygenase [Acetobacter conturbans]|uniref:2-oxoglutarate-dependent ethylene/succinate-forming enzyme n=1 Tax=Acetobacter conturbans TaxID=1737472 RepID=A0ABX0JZ47_9PROT|nr:isopenicillin N synthase family oxygenase [Acetobacter conturbans]NHN88616.1 isopenicillin N synthase family oxygenase [Acetobacter conturbans]
MAVVQTGNGFRKTGEGGLNVQRTAFTEIPMIDLAGMMSRDAAVRREVGEAVRRACTEVGFFYVCHHGVDPQSLARCYAVSKAFFMLSEAEKCEIHIRNSENHRGYGPLLEENTNPDSQGDLHEAFDLAGDIPQTDPDVLAGKRLYGPNLWPRHPAGFRDAVLECRSALVGLGHTIFRAFALALGLEEDYFQPLVEKPCAHMRILRYPPQKGVINEKQIGIGAHSDYECFTILHQNGESALQVLNAAGTWIEAPPIPGTFVINVGDMMARWTNDLFCSTLHRVINRSGKERYSIPLFFGPNFDTIISPLPSCQDADHPPLYPPVKAGDYVLSRFDETYVYRQPTAETV